MPVPPKLARRLVLVPLVLALEVALLVASPLLLLLTALVSPLFGGLRPLRAALIGVAFIARHPAALVACFALWLRRAGCDEYYAVLRWFVGGMYRTIVALARVNVEATESAAAGAALSAHDKPVLVLSRHAGEGDTLLVIHELLCVHRRDVRIVMHEALRLDPLLDVIGNRLPNRFVDPRGGDTESEIAAMARDLEPNDALVIFPEGANFSQERREKGIRRLEERGHEEQARWAREMHRVSAPRPGGALAAIDACPELDVVILGHVGFPTGLGEVWRELPRPQTIEIRLWHVPPKDVPTDDDERIRWLFGWWRTLDAWVTPRETVARTESTGRSASASA